MREIAALAGVMLLAGPASGSEMMGTVSSNGGAARSHTPSLLSAWSSREYSARSRPTAGDALRSDTAPMTGMKRLRGGWLGVDVVQEIAKAYLSPGGKDGPESGGKKGSGVEERTGGGGGGRGDNDGCSPATNGRRRANGRDREKSGSGRLEGVSSARVEEERGETSGKTTGRVGGSSSSTSSSKRGDGSGNSSGDLVRGSHTNQNAGREGGAAGNASGGGNDSGGGSMQEQIERLRAALQQAGAGTTGGNTANSGERGAASATMGNAGGREITAHNVNNRSSSSSSSGSSSSGGANSSKNSGGGTRSYSAPPSGHGAASDTAPPLPPARHHSPGPESESNAGAPLERYNELSHSGDGTAGTNGGGSPQGTDHGARDERWRSEGGSWGTADAAQGERDVEAGMGNAVGRDTEDVYRGDRELYEGGGGKGGGGEDKDEEASRAEARASAERTRREIAFLKEIEQMDAQRQEESLHAPLGQHARSVMTEAMPKRFVDEVGAHIASALAIAAFKGMIQAVVNIRARKKTEKVLFSDVVGCDEAKNEIKQIVDFLVDPTAYDSIGASRPKGILLVGPPGTGKTLIAKACAGEAGVPFLYACGSDFNGIFVGMGVAAVKKLFAKARKHKKSIIYIDEIDFLGRSRNSGARDASGATQDREATLNQLLSEMDGFEGKDGIVVMASTNRKDILDDALLRSGRFDMQVDVERPDRKGRQQLFSKYITPLKLTEGADEKSVGVVGPTQANGLSGFLHKGGRFLGAGAAFGGVTGGAVAAALAAEREKKEEIKRQGLRDDLATALSDLTPYMTGADVANVCSTAGRIAARSGSNIVSLDHFSAAVDRVQHGLEKPDKEISKEEKERTAVHEAGHAVAGWMLPWCSPVVKVSIIWRGNALGFSQTAMSEKLSRMKESVYDDVCMTLAGRAAEEVVCGTISGGASSDLRTASRALYTAITEVGFSNTTGLLTPGSRSLSEKVKADVDQEVQTILAEQYQRALDLIRTHRDKIDLLTASLMANNVVHKADLENLLGEKVTVQSAAEEAALAKASASSGVIVAAATPSGAGS